MSSPTLSREPPEHRPLVEVLDERRGTFGMSLFITSEAMLFALLFGAYFFLGAGPRRWKVDEPPKLHFALPMLALLVLSSIVLHWGDEQANKERYVPARLALIATMLLGLLFIVLSYFDFHEELRSLTPRTDAYGSIFYTILGTHLTHLSVGLLMMLWVLPQLRPGKAYHNVSLYWHFVDSVWVAIVVVLFILPHFGL